MMDNGKQNPDVESESLLSRSSFRFLSDDDFKRICDAFYETSRIDLSDKKELVHTRLNKRLRQLGISTYSEYIDYAFSEESGREFANMVDVLTTNLTFFFREPDHFTLLAEKVIKPFVERNDTRLRVWSAGSSSGEEAFTAAIVLRENIPDIDRRDILILGTDISRNMIDLARNAVYPETRFKNTLPAIRDKYFSRLNERPNHEGGKFKAKADITSLVRFNQLNLMAPWPMKGPFDVIFCRNVMIYFNRETQAELVNRYFDILRPGGYLMVGHAENLTGFRHNFKFVKSSIYIKPE